MLVFRVSVVLLALLAFSSCRQVGLSGSPAGHDGWQFRFTDRHPADVWEALRSVVRDHGEISDENPEEMKLTGLHYQSERYRDSAKTITGRVIDESEDGKAGATLVVYARHRSSVDDSGDQNLAQRYCFTVVDLLEARDGRTEEDPGVGTSGEPPLRDDEAVAFFAVSVKAAFDACRKTVAQYGEIDQEDEAGGFIRGRKVNALEPNGDEVRVRVYDRAEEGASRVKVSVRVRSGGKEGDRPRQETAKAYLKEIRKLLEAEAGR